MLLPSDRVPHLIAGSPVLHGNTLILKGFRALMRICRDPEEGEVVRLIGA